jgi:hypothetical protein
MVQDKQDNNKAITIEGVYTLGDTSGRTEDTSLFPFSLIYTLAATTIILLPTNPSNMIGSA